tara:strand:- start:4 stop:510 length:507 start_codon:yes stop_codon:yes gene_type:complete
MSTVVNKVTLEIRESADPAEYDSSEWLIGPTLPDAPKRHWIVEGDNLREATEEEKGPIDVEYLAEQKELRIQELREQYNEALESRYQTRTLLYANYLLTKAMASMNDEAVDYLASLAQWVEDGDVLVEAAEELIESSETPEDAQAVSLTLTSWLAADPKVSTRAARKL